MTVKSFGFKLITLIAKLLILAGGKGRLKELKYEQAPAEVDEKSRFSLMHVLKQNPQLPVVRFQFNKPDCKAYECSQLIYKGLQDNTSITNLYVNMGPGDYRTAIQLASIVKDQPALVDLYLGVGCSDPKESTKIIEGVCQVLLECKTLQELKFRLWPCSDVVAAVKAVIPLIEARKGLELTYIRLTSYLSSIPYAC